MSACISRAGEFSDHKWGGDFTCARCWVFDEDAALAALSAARADVAAARAETQRLRDAVEGLCNDHEPWSGEQAEFVADLRAVLDGEQ